MENLKPINRQLTDTHAHLIELQKKQPAVFQAIAPRLATELAFLVDVGISIDNTAARLALLQTLGLRYFTLGLYPSYAQSPTIDSDLAELEAQIKRAKANQSGLQLVAVGEMGIDHFKDYGPLQNNLFVEQVRLANLYQLPIVVHCRQAEADILAALQVCKPLYGGVMHCFSSDPQTMGQFLDHGMHISFAGNATYTSAQSIRDAITQCPQDKILSETDSPYLSPKPFQGKPNHPGQVQYTIDLIASLLGQEIAETEAQLYENAQTCFRV